MKYEQLNSYIGSSYVNELNWFETKMMKNSSISYT